MFDVILRYIIKASTGCVRLSQTKSRNTWKELPMAVSGIAKGGEDLSPGSPHTEVGNAQISIFQINPMLGELETLSRLWTKQTDQE